MTITSPEFSNNTQIPTKFTCDGLNINPELNFSDIPEGTKSLALIMDDPDAPSGIFNHWIVWNIDPNTTTIKENSIPNEATQGINSFGNHGYGGPCPPDKEHRYVFRLYALNDQINLKSFGLRADLNMNMADKVIAEAELIGLYSRK